MNGNRGFGLPSFSCWVWLVGSIEYNILSDCLFPDCVTCITMAEPKDPPKGEIPQIQGYSRTALFQNNEAASRWYILLPCI
jgi:hypothetical protein